MAKFTETWGPSNEHVFLDSLGASQNSDAIGGASAEALVQAVDDSSAILGSTGVATKASTIVSTGVGANILFKNPA